MTNAATLERGTDTRHNGEHLPQALAYAKRWPVFPCKEGSKTPATPHGFKNATRDPEAIRRHWQRNPRFNIGIPTGAESGLVALDLDDTLLDHDQLLSRENHDALIADEQQGVRIVLASGRGPFAMKAFLQQLEMDRREGFAVCFNGALVIRSDTGEHLLKEGLPQDVAKQVMEWAEDREAAIQSYRDDTIYLSRENTHTHIDSKLTGLKQVVVSAREIAAMQPIKYVFPGDPQLLQQYQKELRELLGSRANVFVSKPYFLEVMAPAADKGHGLAHLSEVLGLQREQVMAVGDAANDFGMLEWAGFSVAMANAVPEAKQIADAVTERDNHHAGVAEAIRRWVLQ